jgi:hypothetical protein
MRNRIVSIAWTVLSFGALLSASAQSNGHSWSDEVWIIGGNKELRYPFKKWKPELQFDGRYTVLNGEAARIFGLRFGAEHKRVHRFGVGIYGWSSAINERVSNQTGKTEEFRYNLSYSSIFYERVMYFSRKVEFALTAHLGGGTISSSVKAAGETIFHSQDTQEVLPLEISGSGFYNFTWWLSVGGGLGYRYMRRAPDIIRNQLNGQVYVLKARLRITKLLRSIYNKDVKNEY